MAVNYPRPIPPGGIMVAPVVIPPFTVQVKDLGPPGLPPDPSKIRERDEKTRARNSEADRLMLAQLDSQEQTKRDLEEKKKKSCKIKKDRFCPGRPDLWKCVNNGDPTCPPSNSRATMNSTLTKKSAGGPSYRTTYTTKTTVEKGGHLPYISGRDGDDVSFATTDTQKLLAMLKESEGEIEGLSISSSMKADSGKSSTESIFEPLKNLRRGGYMRVVRKKPSPDPISRLERRWARRNDPPPPATAPPPAPAPPPLRNACDAPASSTTPDDSWWLKSGVNWRDTAQSKLRKNCTTGGYAAERNADTLPAIAHLSDLGKITGDSSAPGAMTQGIPKRSPQTKPWTSADTQNYFSKDQPIRTQNYNSQNHDRQPQPQDRQTRSTRNQPRPNKSRTRTIPSNPGNVASPSDPEWGSGLYEDPKPQAPFVSNVFVRDMVKTRNANLSRVPGMKVITKVPGDPATIKRTNNAMLEGHFGGQSGAPPSLEASDLMMLEEDINETEQQEDAKRLAIFMSADLKDQVFTDVIIKCKNHVYRIHKEFLLAFTSYDIPVIAGEPLRDFPALDLTDLDSSDVATVLHFLYYGELKLSVYNILGVRATAHALGVVDIPAVIEEFHNKLFHPANLINLIELAEGKGLEELFTYCWKLFVAGFYDHINGGNFLNWDLKWVLNLLGHEAIPIKTELEVFEAARLWLNYRPEERSESVKSVLTTVRWTYMTPEEMVECEREDPYLMSRQEAHELVSDANWYKIMMRNGVPWTDFNIPPPRGNPTNPGRVNRLPNHKGPICTGPSTVSPCVSDFDIGGGSAGGGGGGGCCCSHTGGSISGGLRGGHSSGHSAANCPYARPRSVYSERGIGHQQSSMLSRDYSRDIAGTALSELYDRDDMDAFSETSFNSLDVDVSNLSCIGDECREF